MSKSIGEALAEWADDQEHAPMISDLVAVARDQLGRAITPLLKSFLDDRASTKSTAWSPAGACGGQRS